jgi:O-antigen/teichoic acid export membrane protein
MILSMLHARLAVFLLDAYTTPADVGIYGVAHKLTEPLAIVPAAIMAAVFPAISSGAGRVPGRLRTLTIAVLAGAGALVAFAGYFAAPFVVQLLYADQYAASAAPLRILVVTVLFTFVNYALTHFLVAERRVHVSVLFTAVTLAVNGAACALLIPLYGPTGAAMSLLASEAVLFALCAAALGRSWRSG